MTKTRTVTVKWCDDELIDHEVQLDVPADRGRGGIEYAVAEKMSDYNVAVYNWHVKDNITFDIIYKIENFMDWSNLRYRVIEDDSDSFVFQLTDYYSAYVQFDVDLVEFAVGLSYDANVTDLEVKNASMVFAAVTKILKEVKDKIKE